MAYSYAASVSQAVPANAAAVLTYTDESTGIVGLVSKVLSIFDANGVLLQTINMGAATVAPYSITADGYFSFQLMTIDSNGDHPGVTNFLSTAFYQSLYAPEVAAIPSQCYGTVGVISNLSNAQNNRYAAIDMATFGQGVVAQELITYANFLLVTPYYANQ